MVTLPITFIDEAEKAINGSFAADTASDDYAVWHPADDNLPQQTACDSPADEVYYGGAAGGGKTDLGLGLCLTRHRRSIFFRREYRQLSDAIDRTIQIAGTDEGLNRNAGIFRRSDGRVIEFAAMQLENDKFNFKGRPHDLYVFDEVCDFSESQFLFVKAWERTTIPGQRTRILLAGNPPTTPEGEWVIRRYAPWLDPEHPDYPEEPGKLRWYARINDEDVELPNGDPFQHNGETIKPKSRTFIPAHLEDNPFLRDTEYKSVLQSLPEPLKSQLLKGDHTIKAADDRWQVIPTEHVKLSQKRWLQTERPDVELRSVGNDVARGGKDKTVIAPLYGTWFDHLRAYPGIETPDGDSVVDKLLEVAGLDDLVGIDVVGVGASVYDAARRRGMTKCVPINNGAAPDKRALDKTKKYKFANVRSESHWKFREALDPNSGEDICLPPGLELLRDLCAPRFKIVAGKIYIESKDEIIARIGRSPDMGDAVVLAWYATTHGGMRPKVRVLEWE